MAVIYKREWAEAAIQAAALDIPYSELSWPWVFVADKVTYKDAGL